MLKAGEGRGKVLSCCIGTPAAATAASERTLSTTTTATTCFVELLLSLTFPL